MIAELLFLLGIEYQEDESRTVCGIVAGLLHYSFLGLYFQKKCVNLTSGPKSQSLV